MSRLELSRLVEIDLDEIAAYIARDNPRRAVGLLQEIRVKFKDIERALDFINCGRTSARRPEWQRLGTTPYCSV